MSLEALILTKIHFLLLKNSMNERRRGNWSIQHCHQQKTDPRQLVHPIYVSVNVCLIKCMLACGNKILIVGGEDEEWDSLDTTEWFDGTISNGPTMLNARAYSSCAFINGRQS